MQMTPQPEGKPFVISPQVRRVGLSRGRERARVVVEALECGDFSRAARQSKAESGMTGIMPEMSITGTKKAIVPTTWPQRREHAEHPLPPRTLDRSCPSKQHHGRRRRLSAPPVVFVSRLHVAVPVECDHVLHMLP